MRTIGLIGGISPHSTLLYYKKINELTNKLLGSYNSAKMSIISVNFEDITTNIFSGNWDRVAMIMEDACIKLQNIQPDCLAFCSNTLYRVAGSIEKQISTHFIHILDPIINIIQNKGYRKIGILGTIYTMKLDFYKNYLTSHLDIEVIVPNLESQRKVNHIIFNELCHGVVLDKSKYDFQQICNNFKKRGVDAVILGCTELSLIFSSFNPSLVLLDSTNLHIRYLVQYALANVKEIDRSKLTLME